MSKPDLHTNKEKLNALYNEVDCRIEHGADSNGHLEYVLKELLKILSEGCDD